LSVPPVKSGKIEDGTDWLGSPSFNLPRRQIVKGFDDKVIFKPTLKLYIQRYLIDFLRIFIPSTIEILGVLSTFYTAYFLYETQGIYSMLGLLPLIALLVAIASTLIVVFVKWLLMGRIKATVKPLWSTFVWFNEAVNGAYESITAQMLAPLIGTPFFAPFLRLLGCKIGRNVHMGTSLFSEFDLVEIGDNVSLNAGVVIQNHLFEDRIMKASSLRIKEDCNIGNMSIVLYDSIIDSNTSIAPLSLVMKGEKLPSNSKWTGIPCQVV
jgi:non-ribosomal peptide synthetase-like protein